MNADALPPDELLAFLSPAQQAAFTSTLSDPDRINALVTQELETEQPWWIEDEDEADFDEEEEVINDVDRKPPMLEVALLPTIPLDERGRPKTSAALVYNIVAVLCVFLRDQLFANCAADSIDLLADWHTPLPYEHSP